MGATACGKTQLSLLLAQKLNAEIISVDSALVYRGMNIGTAKPTLTERQGITHHLIDICDPWQSYSAAEFCKDACTLIDQIHKRQKSVLLVGGTMLYFKALEHGLAKLPQAHEPTRRDLIQESKRVGWPALHAKLQEVDQVAASRIHPNDSQRIMRALEVYQLTGEPLTSLQTHTAGLLPVKPVKFALMPGSRQWLHRRIEQRFDNMINEGFVDEVRRLYEHPKVSSDLPAMRSVGYRQAWEAINRSDTSIEWHDKAVAATRQLAKRQLTWLRSMSDVQHIACDSQTISEQVSVILSALNEST
ncbi:MAG: tRNA (adenosine(37)-N6)-dimethylallyltransferase MiaA [Granulosicoccus sp.]|nr:tRNA (adenosine(37)-N6)-dimethylallyltransferase MiaA [Granulosicoccus sp.]